MSRASLLCTACLAGCLAAAPRATAAAPQPSPAQEPAAAPAREELAAVPEPSLETLTAADREQIERQRAILDDLLARPGAPRRTLAEAFGELGQIYFLYDLMDVAEVCFENARRLDPGEFRWHYFPGVVHSREGRLEEAAASLARAVEIRPDDLAARLRRGLALLDAGRLEEAEEQLQAALEIDSESAAAHYGLGRVAYSRGRAEIAAERFRRALELQPGADSIHHLLGLALRKLGDLEGARHHLALNRHGLVDFPDPLVDDLNRLLKAARVHVREGNFAAGRGDLEGALAEYQQAVAADPEDRLAVYNLGWVLAQLGREDEALAHFRRAVELDPDYRNAHFNLATALGRRGQWREAAHHYQRAYRIDPQDHLAHLEWALALEKAGDLEGAVEQLQALLEADPGNAPALWSLAGFQVRLGDARGAAESLEALVATDVRDPVKAQAYHLLGKQAEAAGDLATAAERYRQAVDLAPGSREAQLNLANSLGRMGRFPEAAREFDRAVALAPEDDRAHMGRAMSLLLAEEHGRALEALEESHRARPGNAAVQDLLARVLAASPDPAVRNGERALALARPLLEGEPRLDFAETLAMALAETGRFEEAARVQRQVTEQAAAADPRLAERSRRRLALYESGRPCRSPWRDG